MRIAAIIVSTGITLLAIALAVRAVQHMTATIRTGGPAVGRTDRPGLRWLTMLRETVGHTKMAQGGFRRWRLIGVAHWFVFVGFGLLFFTLVTAYGQLYAGADWALPLIGHFWPYELMVETIAAVMLVAILLLMVIRQIAHPRWRGRSSRFSGSRMWMGYYVELTILAIGAAILVLRGLEGALAAGSDGTGDANDAGGAGAVTWDLHHAISAPLASAFAVADPATLSNAIWLVGAAKIVVSMAWVVVIASNLTMGVAWHRFTAFPNIWFRREADGRPALGALQPMYSGGAPIDFDDPGEDDTFGAGRIEDFSWKGMLDFTTCTECGRCQSVCPAWATDKPLSPKQLVMDLREHAYAKANESGGTDGADVAGGPEHERALVGPVADGGVIDPDVLWACTNCGACVQECPVDIEHVDHITDMRRNQVLIESEFPDELGQLFRGMESKGNPWNMPASARLDWTKGLPFEVEVLGRDVEDLSEVEYLFWVGCAGAYDDRGKQTTRALAELLHIAGVSFAVLGEAETCTGDAARRTGNEFVYRQLAEQNSETFTEAGATKVIVTCAHCFNTIKNEYAQLGVELQVVHHTQLLNRLVREGRLRPAPPEDGQDGQRPITYHDPCFLGRHNGEYDAPRELIGAMADVELREMPRNSERSFCCGAGGGRMWMEEGGPADQSSRINYARAAEAIQTGAEQIATGCPFCRVMLSDGATAIKEDDATNGQIEVLDVAQLLLAAVRRGIDAEAAPTEP